MWSFFLFQFFTCLERKDILHDCCLFSFVAFWGSCGRTCRWISTDVLWRNSIKHTREPFIHHRPSPHISWFFLAPYNFFSIWIFLKNFWDDIRRKWVESFNSYECNLLGYLLFFCTSFPKFFSSLFEFVVYFSRAKYYFAYDIRIGSIISISWARKVSTRDETIFGYIWTESAWIWLIRRLYCNLFYP